MKRLACYFPLIAIGLEIGWVIVLSLGFIFVAGGSHDTNAETKNRFFNLAASLPVVSGLIVGMVALAARFPVRRLEWIILLIGTGACTLLSIGFIYGFTTG